MLDLNGFELLEEAGAPTDLNALLMGSVLVAAAGAAAGLGNVTAELEEGLKKPVDSESELLPTPPDVNAELLIGFEGACLGAAEGVAEGLGKPLEAAGADVGLWKPLEAAGADVGLWNPFDGVAEGLGNPADGAGFSLGSGALNAELIGLAGSSLAAGAAEAEGVVCVLAKPALGKPADGAGFSLGSGALNAELMG